MRFVVVMLNKWDWGHLRQNISDRARLDISARGLWGPFQKSMFDVRIFHPNAATYRTRRMADIYKLHEKMKCRDYQQRVLQVEKATFTPLVYSTTGGMASQATMFHKKLAQLISDKRREQYSDVMNCRKLNCLLRC